jgi:hypothetical protein
MKKEEEEESGLKTRVWWQNRMERGRERGRKEEENEEEDEE